MDGDEALNGLARCPSSGSIHWKSSTKFFIMPKSVDDSENHPPEVTHELEDHKEKTPENSPAIMTPSSSDERMNNLLLPDLSTLGQEKNKSRVEWRIHTQSRLEHVCDAILQDNREQIEIFFSTHPSYKIRSLTFPAKLESRAGNIITSKSFTLGHLLALFATPLTLQTLENKNLLAPSLFRLRCDLEVEYLSADIILGQGPSSELREHFRSVPCSFMTAMRDNLPTLMWLFMKGYLRRHGNEVDSTGRNLMHCCVDEESPTILQEILTNRKIFSWDALEEMLRTRESSRDDTPFTRAVRRIDPVMLVFFIHVCPEPFVSEHMDLSGISKSVINLLLTHLNDTTLCMSVLKEFLKRGSIPDRHPNDDTPCIETLIENVNFSGPDLKHAVKLLLKYGAKPTSGALLKLLRLRFRTDEELSSLFKILLKAGGTRVLLGDNAFRIWSSERTRGKLRSAAFGRGDGNSVVMEILKNQRISVSKMERLFTFISQFADISSMFPDADGIAMAISERMAFDHSRDTHTDLEQILRLLLRFACTHTEEENVRGFLDRLLRGLLRFLFERNDYSKAEKPYDKVMAYISHVLQVMEKLQMDFNAVVEGQVGLFSLFHANVPDDVVVKTLDILPKNFDCNLMTGQSDNLATMTIKRFSQDFEMVYKIFMHLKEIGFDFTKTVFSGETLLMVYVRKCGETFDQMETGDTLTAYIEEDFFRVMRFLFDEHVDMTHRAASENTENRRAVNVLGVAMQLSHCTIAEEILKINPKLMESVHVETILTFIRNCPEVLEFLNGRSLLLKCNSHSKGLDKEDLIRPGAHTHLGSSIDATDCYTTIRTVWLNYIQHNHEAMLKFVGEDDEQNDFTKQVELIYDYLVHSTFDESEEDELTPSKVAMEFSVFRRPELDLLPHTLETVNRERVNAPLFLKIVEECDSIEHHPLFTEYFEKFYRTAFFNSLAFILYHVAFLICLNGAMVNVVTPVTHYALTSPKYLPGHFKCYIDKCSYVKLNATMKSYIVFEAQKPSYNESNGCEVSYGHTCLKSLCKNQSNVNRTECPFTMHFSNGWIIPVVYLLLTMAVIGIIRETIQLVMDPRDYMRSYIQNPLELSMYFFVVAFAINITNCPSQAGFKTQWQFELGCVAVLYSWFMLFFYMSKFPAFATYVIMFYQAVKSGLGLLVTFSSLLLGFSFEYHLILGNQLMYRSIWTSINKVWLMVAGEIDYKDTMTSHFGSPGDTQVAVPYEVLTRVMLILFILLISIVLMNLFIGLIVGDVDTINKLAENKKWKWNLEFIEYTDALSDFFNKWMGPIRRRCCCNDEEKLLAEADPYHRERRATKFIIERQIGKHDFSDSEKAGLYVTDLSWRNMFKWYIDFTGNDAWKWGPIANFFGFVARKELLKRLMVIEVRKRKLRMKYSSRRRLERLHAADGDIVKRVNLPSLSAMAPDYQEDSEPESEVTIHDENAAQLKKISQPAAYLADEQLDASHSEEADITIFLPRHERRALRRLLRPGSVNDIDKTQVGVGVQPPRPFFPSFSRQRGYGRSGPYTNGFGPHRV